MIIDAHQHFWRLDRGDYAFPSPQDPVLYRNFMPPDLQAILDELGIDRTVLVQATDTIEESRFLLDLARETPFVAGVVGWWDLVTPELLEALLEGPGSELIVGVRPMLQRFDDVGWLAHPDTTRKARRLVERGLVLDALVDTRHLATLHGFCAGLPELKVVIDHMGKPWRSPERFAEWKEAMQWLGELPSCWVKVSGFPFAQPAAAPSLELDALLECLRQWFPPDRLVWGSDWPVVSREGGYATALEAIRSRLTPAETDVVMADNAVALYGLRL